MASSIARAPHDEDLHVEGLDDETVFGLDLKLLLGHILRNRFWIAGICGGFLLAGVIITMLLVPSYTAVSAVMVEDEGEQIIEGSDLSPTVNGSDTERFLQTQMDILRSRQVAGLVVDKGNLALDQTFYDAMGAELPERSEQVGAKATPDGFSRYVREEAINLLTNALAVSMPVESRVISIEVVTHDPRYSAKLADLFADAFIENNLNRKFNSSAYARKFLTEQLEDARLKLETSEHELNQYSRAAGLIRMQGASGGGATNDGESALSITNSTLINLNDEASKATSDRIAAEQAWRAVEDQPVLNIPSVLSSNSVERLLGERARLEAELADESSKHRANYPSVVGLKAQLTEINARIQSIGQSIKKSIQLTYEAASQREANLRAEVEQLQKSSMDEQNSGVQYNLLKRVADTNRSLYDTLLARFNQLNAASGAVSNNITVVDYAEVPTTPSSPKMLINLVIALLIGLVVSALVILLREYFDDAIRSPEDVERKLGIPLLALVPNSEDVQSAISNVRSPVAEAYHTLVANLSLSTQTGLPRVLMLTSSKESEGKSSSCEAIARDLAALGKSVLLVDADLRRPTLHSKFCDRKAPGLSAYLTGNASFEEVLQPSGVENLTCITALPIPLQPSLLLGGVRLGELVARARAMFDVVILDCPPMLGLSDTASISAYVDGVLVVIDAQAYHRGAVKSVLRRLQLTGAPVLGVALTKFDTQRAHGQYSYYGNNYYQYGDASKA